MSQRKSIIFLVSMCLLLAICFSIANAQLKDLSLREISKSLINTEKGYLENRIIVPRTTSEQTKPNRNNRAVAVGLRRLTNPKEQRVEGLTKASCIAVDDGKICHGLTDESVTGSLFVVLRNETRLNSWQGHAFLGDTSLFEILQGDLDGDGKSETVIANRDGQSNGMGVNYWTIYILPWSTGTASSKPLQFAVEDYGANGTFVLNKKSQSIEILETRWDWGLESASSKKDGLYLVGRWFRYQNGMLILIEKPIVVRRYVRSFEKERLRTINGSDIPYLWLKHASSETGAIDNIKDPSIESGVIEFVSLSEKKNNEEVPERSLLSLKFKTDSGKTLTLFYIADSNDNKNFINLIGDEAKRTTYPKSYLPSDPELWLKGRRASLGSYARSNNGQRFTVLWIN